VFWLSYARKKKHAIFIKHSTNAQKYASNMEQ